MKKVIAILCVLSAGQMVQAQSPTHIDLAAPPNVVAPAVPVEGPTGCTVIYDGEFGQVDDGNYNATLSNANSGRAIWGDLLDLLVVDDFVADRSGIITDAYLWAICLDYGRVPADGVRIYLWGSGDLPSEEPTQVWEIPADQIQVAYSQDPFGMPLVEIHATSLNIPYEQGRNWITIQPRDESSDGDWYYTLRNTRRPLQGADAYIKDGPNGEGGYGFTDWRSASSQGHNEGDSFIRLETCSGSADLSISITGDCDGTATFTWIDAPPNEELTFIYAKNTGNFRIPGPMVCGGTELGLGARFIQQAFTVNTGETGEGVHEVFLPALACPGYFQAVIRGDGPCETSNVVPTP